MFPNCYQLLHKRFFWFYGESPAFPARATKFFPLEILNSVPKRSRLLRGAADRLVYFHRRPGNRTDQHFLSSRPRNPVHGKPIVRLKHPDSALGVPALDAVNRAGRIAQIGEQALNLFDGQAKSFGLVHFATNENLMLDVFHMFVIGNDPATAGYWHRMNNKMDLEKELLVNVANQDLGAVHTWLIDMLKNGKSVTVGIARNGNDVYTLLNGVIVWKTQIADGIKDVDTVPAIMMNSNDGDTRSVTDIVYLTGEAATNKINNSQMLVTSINLDEETLTLTKDEQKTLTVTVNPSYAAERIVWESTDTNVVTVNNGVVAAVKAGSATITAKIGDVKAEVVVTVVDFKFEQQNYSLAPSGTEKLNLVFGEGSVEGQTVAYASSNDNIVSIDADGVVTAKAYGRVTITATIKGVNVECTVTVSPLATNNGVNVTYKDDGAYNMIQLLAGINVNALNTGAKASKVYYVEYKLNGLEMHNGQVKSFGMAHFATSESYMYDAFHMFLLGEDVTTGGYWHRMNVGADLDNNLLLNQANDELGMARDYIVSALQNGKSFTFGIARNGNYVYTLINGVVVLQTNIADGLKDVDTVPALFMNVMDGENRTISDITFFEGKEATDKINGATRMLRYSRVADGNYKPVTIAADSSSLRFSGVDSADSAWRASVTQEVLFGANVTIDMDIVVHNTANGHIGINIAKNDGNGWTSKNNFSDGLTLVGYWMWTNEGKQQGVDYIHDMPTAWATEWCGGPADENKSGSFHINITLQRSEDGTVKSVLTLTNGATVMQTVEKTLTNQYSADEQYRIHFLSHAIDYEVTNLTIAENN